MDDLISRQAAIDALEEKPLAWTEGEYELGLKNQWEHDTDAIKALPPVTLLPKGHGRLGDLDALEVEMSNGIKAGLMIEGYENYSNINDVDDCLECVKYADTIIEADRSEEE